MKYALYLGCTIPNRFNNYDASARRVCSILGIELVDIEGWGCCGPVHVRSLNHDAFVAMGARNLALAEKMGLPIMTLCNGCYSSLKETNQVLKENMELRQKVNEILKNEDLEFKGTTEVKHLVQVLYNDYGVNKIKKFIQNPFKDLQVAVHYGCHSIRPSEHAEMGDPEDPRIVDELVEITGAKSVSWPLKLVCCGAPVLSSDESVAIYLIKRKLDSVKASGAECTVQICPFCEVQFELMQIRVERDFEVEYGLPALFYPQLLGLALGISPDLLGFDLNRIPGDPVFSKLTESIL
jgi:heterodisulfide reductase subunit B